MLNLESLNTRINHSRCRMQKVVVEGDLRSSVSLVRVFSRYEGLPGVLGNKGTLAKYRREQGNTSKFLGTEEQNFEKLQYENILRECGNMGT